MDEGGARLAGMSMPVALGAAEEAARELPLPPWTFGIMALLAFAFLLGVTWSFRGTSQKYARPDLEGVRQDAAATGPDRRGEGLGDGGAGDEPHWPEHPGHQH